MNDQHRTDSPKRHESLRFVQSEQYNILGSGSESIYSDIVRFASLTCKAPIALITFLGAYRQWMKPCIGVDRSELPREYASCQYPIQQRKKKIIVECVNKDDWFQTHSLVAGELYLVFYAGMPLTNKRGYALGTICVLGTKPRSLNDRQLKALQLLSIQLIYMLELRRIRHEHDVLHTKLQSCNPVDEHIQTVTAQIRRSLTDIVTEALEWEDEYNWKHSNISACSEGVTQMSIDIKALIERLIHYPQNG